MQITDLSVEEKITPLFRLGFRPFFFLGALFSVVAIMLWVLMQRGAITFTPYGGGYFWHLHEMVFGFMVAIIAGFVLTAVQNWTNIPSVKSWPLAALVGLWLLGRICMLFPNLLGNTASMLIDLSFLPVLAVLLGRPIIKIKQYRNLFFVPLFLTITLFNLQMHLAPHFPQSINVIVAGYGAVMLITTLVSVMAGRVTPMFTANGTKTTKVDAIPALEKLCTISLVSIAVLYLLHPVISVPNMIFAVLFLVAASAQVIRWFRWKPWITFSVPLLWSLHFSLGFIWLGLLTLGLAYFSDSVVLSATWHVLTIGGLSGVVLAMISRVSLGHTGRPLQPPKAMSFAYSMVYVAVFIRTFAVVLWPEQKQMLVDMSALCWFVAFGLFTFLYAPMFLRPRADGRPG